MKYRKAFSFAPVHLLLSQYIKLIYSGDIWTHFLRTHFKSLFFIWGKHVYSVAWLLFLWEGSPCPKYDIVLTMYTLRLLDYFFHSYVTALPLNIFLIDLVGRRWTGAVNLFGCGLFFILLQLPVPQTALTCFIFLVRGFSSGMFNFVYIYTSEVSALQ